MIMTQSYGQSISSIRTQICLRQRQQLRNHVADLLFGGIAIAHHSLFYFPGGVFRDGNPAFSQSQKHHTPGMSQREHTLDVFAIKDALHCSQMRLIFRQNPFDTFIQDTQPVRQGFGFLYMDDISARCHYLMVIQFQ